MPTTFLSLPRELRDQIYEYILISPTGLIEPILIRNPIKAKRARQQHHQPQTQNQVRTKISPQRNDPKIRFVLQTIPSSPLEPLTRHPEAKNQTSLSIRRVCRQITHETQFLFWEHNTLYFSYFHSSLHDGSPTQHNGVVKTLKQMGQTASRLIQCLTIRMSDLEPSYTTLGKILLKFESRARCGKFKKLTLVWEHEEWIRLVVRYMSFERYDVAEQEGKLFAALLDVLGVGREGGRFERVIEVREPWFGRRGKGKMVEDSMGKTARELHLAFGGKVLANRLLMWDGGEQVGPYTYEGEESVSTP